MTVSVTMTFASIDEAVAFLAPRPPQPATVSVSAPAAPAPSKPSAAPAPVAQTAAPSAAPAHTYDSILALLQAKAKTVSPADFRAKLTEWGIVKVPELKGKPELFAEIAAYCAS